MTKTGVVVGGDGNESQDGVNQSKSINCTFLPPHSQSFWEPPGYALRYEAPGVSEANRRSEFPCSVIVLNYKGMYVSFTEK